MYTSPTYFFLAYRDIYSIYLSNRLLRMLVLLLFILVLMRLALRLSLVALLLVDRRWGAWIGFMLRVWGEDDRLRSVSFCRDLERELVLKTEVSSFLTSFEPFLS